jgi:hypothetical protein
MEIRWMATAAACAVVIAASTGGCTRGSRPVPPVAAGPAETAAAPEAEGVRPVPTLTLDLGGGAALELVLIPPGRHVQGRGVVEMCAGDMR